MERKNFQNFDQIKQRLLQFAECQQMPIGVFFEKSGLVSSNFSGKGGKSSLSSDKIVQILNLFTDLNPDWLLLGRGEMLRSASQAVGNISNSTAVGVNVSGNGINITNNPLQSLVDTINSLTEQNARLIDQLAAMTELLNKQMSR